MLDRFMMVEEIMAYDNAIMDELLATQAQIDQWAADCFATIPQGASDYDKALGVFTYIIQHADYQVVDNNSIVNIMVGGT